MFESIKNGIYTIQNKNPRIRGMIVLLIAIGIFIFIVSVWIGFFYTPPSIQREQKDNDTETNNVGESTKQVWDEIKKGIDMISSTTQEFQNVKSTSTERIQTSTTTATSSN